MQWTEQEFHCEVLLYTFYMHLTSITGRQNSKKKAAFFNTELRETNLKSYCMYVHMVKTARRQYC